MYRQIGVEFLLANRFRKVPHEAITYTSLRHLRSKLESAIEGFLYVDISASSIVSAVEQYPKMFRWDGEAVRRVEGAERYFSEDYVESHFNSEVDESIRSTALDVVLSA